MAVATKKFLLTKYVKHYFKYVFHLHFRYMPHYILPGEDNFSVKPSKAHFKYCKLLVIVHSTIDAFNDRQGVRDTWIQYVTENRVQNVSVIFLVAKEKSGENITQLVR